MNRKMLEIELDRAKKELFMANNLQRMRFIQKKISYLQEKMREGG